MRSSNYKDEALGLSLLTGIEVKKQNSGKRKCRWVNCSTRLNSYNPNGYCHAHVSKGVWKEAKEEDERHNIYTREAGAKWQAKQKLKKKKKGEQGVNSY